MANGNGNNRVTWNIVLPVGALALLGSLMQVVSKDASIALDVARQHGEELLLIRGEMTIIEKQLMERTQQRYTSQDAARDHEYIYRDIKQCQEWMKEHDARSSR